LSSLRFVLELATQGRVFAGIHARSGGAFGLMREQTVSHIIKHIANARNFGRHDRIKPLG